MTIKGMTYVGIDPSLTGTGICVFNSGSGNDDEMPVCTIKTEKKNFENSLQRYLYIVNTAIAFIKSAAIFPPTIFIEGYSFGSRGAAVFSLAEFGGLLRYKIAKRFNEYYEIPPTVLKKFITGKGNSNKNVMLEQTFRKYGIGSEILTDDNQVDAFSIAQFAKTMREGALPKIFIGKYSKTIWNDASCME